jgi:tetratricopeptide (TPR) repeat protein
MLEAHQTRVISGGNHMNKKSAILAVIAIFVGIIGSVFGEDIALNFQCSFLREDGMRGAALLNQIGVQAMDNDKHDIAVTAFNCATRSYKTYYAPYYNRGLANRHLQNYDVAIIDFETAMDYAPSITSEMYLNLALTYDLMLNENEAVYYYNLYLDAAKEYETSISEIVLARMGELVD